MIQSFVDLLMWNCVSTLGKMFGHYLRVCFKEAMIKQCIPLAPLHNPANLMGIESATQIFQSAKQVAVFDTAFHADMPPESYRYAIPAEFFEKHNVRRYGFHGTSYKFVAAEVAQKLGRPKSELNMIMCHLGNGCSMACVKNGKSIDTTMGMTPLEGLVMGTRSGDLDCGVYNFMCTLGKTAAEVDTILNKKSGLLGVCGMSDMREVIAACQKGDPNAILARALYIERIRKYLGAFLVKLNGKLDALVFTAGVGEGDQELRAKVCDGLLSLGIDVDPAKNARVTNGEIQSKASRIKVLVQPTNEEKELAFEALEVCGYVKPATKAPVAAKNSLVDVQGAAAIKTRLLPVGAFVLVLFGAWALKKAVR